VNDGELRYAFAGDLGSLVYERQDIVNLVEAYAEGIAVADLPEGSARTVWLYVITELARRDGGAKAIQALLDEGARRDKRIDWTKYKQLATPRVVPAGGGAVDAWSDLKLDVPWPGGAAGEQLVVEATVTQQWAGPRPAEPTLAATRSWFFAGRRALPHKWQPGVAKLDGVATWTATFPVAPAALATRRIAVSVDDGRMRRTQVRYLASRAGHVAALVLWLALGGFAFAWLLPFGARVGLLALAVWIVPFGLGWVLPRLRRGAGGAAWVTRAWETSVPLVAALAALVVVLPILVFTIVDNHARLPVSVDGVPLAPGESRTYIGNHRIERPQTDDHYDKTCECRGSSPFPCTCVADPVRLVAPIEIHCIAPYCADIVTITTNSLRKGAPVVLADRATGSEPMRGTATVPLSWPGAFRSLGFDQSAFSSLQIISGGKTIKLDNVAFGPDAPQRVELVVLAGTELGIVWSDFGALACTFSKLDDGATATITRVALFPPLRPNDSLRFDSGGVSSRFQPRTPAPVVRACLRSARVAIDLDPASPGQHIGLPRNAGIEQVAVNGGEVRCEDPQQLRVVATHGDVPGPRIGRITVGRINQDLAVTCSPPGTAAAGGRTCTLDERDLSCDTPHIPIPPQPPQPPTPSDRRACTIVSNNFVYPIETKVCPLVAETDPLARRLHVANPTCAAFNRCLPGGDIDRPSYRGPCKVMPQGPPAALDEPSCKLLEPTDPAAVEALAHADPSRLACTSVFRCLPRIRPPRVDPTHVIRPETIRPVTPPR